MSSLKILCAVALLSACATDPQWAKPGSSAESVAADLQQCRLSAPYEPRTNVPAPPRKPGGIGGTDFNTMAEREGERFMKDERHVSECMRAKGYADAAK